MTGTGRTIAANRLLCINVGAEIEKIASAQLEGPWQLPAELARTGIRLGAHAIDIRLNRHQIDVRLEGADPGPNALQRLAILFHPRSVEKARHAALVQLERGGETALLGLLALDPKEIRIATPSGHSFVYQAGSGPWFGEGVPSEATTIRIRLKRLDARRAASWIRAVCRFAPVPIRLGGEAVTTGLDESLARTSLTPPQKGEIAIPWAGDTATVHLLQHGVVTCQLAVPSIPCFQTTIEFGDKCVKPDAAQVRTLFESVAPSVAEQVIDLLINTSFRHAQASESARKRLCSLLLRALHNRHRLRELVTVPVFRAYDPDVGISLVDLLTLRSWVHRERDGSMVLEAVFPQGVSNVITSRPVAVLDETERSSLANLLHVQFRPPERRPGEWGIDRVRLRERLRRSWEILWHMVRHPGASRPLADDVLLPSELNLLRMLRQQSSTSPVEIHLCSGGGPIRRRGGTRRRVLLPRENAEVQACIEVVERDGAWAYPSAYLLLERHAKPAREIRVSWHRRMPQGG